MNNFQIIDQSKHIIPTVSVAMLTYNHAKFISEAIESVLMQKTNFDVKIIIAEDCSTDATRQIIIDYQKRYPDNIKLILQNKNVGAQKNNIDLLSNMEGKYIAALEGDDYWTDPLKLQKQVDFLDANTNYSGCFTDVSLLKEGKLTPNALKEKHKKDSDSISIFYDTWIPTLTLVFRNSMLIKPLPKQFEKVHNGDLFLFYLLAQNGKIGYLDIVTGVYRQHDKGVWSGSSQLQQLTKKLISLKYMSSYFSYHKEIKHILNQRILNTLWLISKKHYQLKNYKSCSIEFSKLFFQNPVYALKKIVFN